MKKSIITTMVSLVAVGATIHGEKIYTTRGLLITKKNVAAFPEDITPHLGKMIEQEPNATISSLGGDGQAIQENTDQFAPVYYTSHASRFTNIKTSPTVASNEINFWGRQMSEHALFNFLGLEDPHLKQKAFNLHIELETFRKNFNKDPLNMKLMNKILPLLKKGREFQIRVLQTLDAGKWVGWIFPSFIAHVTLELDYFVDKLNDIKYSPQDEVEFWNRINSEHADFTTHFLDPSEKELFSKAKAMADKFLNIPKSEKEMMITLSLKAGKELDAFNKKAQAAGKAIKSIIHPVLLDHVIREGERSIQTLQSLGLHEESIELERHNADQINQYRPSVES